MGYSKEKQEKLIKALNEIACLVGEKHKEETGHIVGLDMNFEKNKCVQEAVAVREGLFKTVVMGTFSSGKSTVINALIGAKLLPESIRPCTAILTFIQYGTDEDMVEIHMRPKVTEIKEKGSIAGETVSPGDIRRMTVSEFNKEFRYSLDDERECMTTGTVSRFADVGYAVMRCSRPLMEGGVRIIDSPGLEDKAVATEMALTMANEAQARIYIAQERGFSKEDKQYILETLKNCPNNVFFLINRIDLLSKKEREEILTLTRNFLVPVFTRKDGTVERELLDRRLFGISALRAIDARRGYVYDKEEDEDVALTKEEREKLLQKSQFLSFEAELERFLTTDEKCVSQYESAFRQMATTYNAAVRKVEGDMHVFETMSHISEGQKEECNRLINEIKINIQLTAQTFDNCSLRIQNTVADLLRQCISQIDDTWEHDLVELKGKVDFANFDYIKIALNNINVFKKSDERDEKLKAAFEPFATTVAEYLTSKIEEFFNQNKVVIEKVIEESEDRLNVQLAKTDELISGLGEAITRKRSASKVPTDQSWLQTILSFMLTDISSSVLTAAGGKLAWMNFVKRSVLNYTWQFLLVTAGGGVGTVIALLIEAFQLNRNRRQFIVNMLSKIKDETLSTIKTSIGTEIDKINAKVAVVMNKAKDEKCGDESQRLVDEERHLHEIEKTLADVAFNFNSERQRCDYILRRVMEEGIEAYTVVMGKVLTPEEFVNL